MSSRKEREAAASSPQRLARRAGAASLIGTTIEWYDYFIFGSAAGVVFGTVFFPSSSPAAGVLASLAVFGVGFFARPLGGFVFGHLGDKLGRKSSLVATLLITGISTMCIGLLPTYESAGILAPILLVVFRLIQGFGVGGEWGGASLVAVEYAPPGKRGLYGSLPQVGNGIGVVLASGAFSLVTLMDDQDFLAWGWRLPFLASAILVVVGMVIRVQLAETPAFEASRKELEQRETSQRKAHPVRRIWAEHRKSLLLAAGIKLCEGTYGYIVLTFLVAYTTTYTSIPESAALLAVTLAGAGSIATYYIAGWLSDFIGGRKGMTIIGAVVCVVMAFPFFWLLGLESQPIMYVTVLGTYLCGNGLIYSMQSSLFSELFPTDIRYTAVSIAYQVPSVLVGLVPFVAMSLIGLNGNAAGVSILITVTSLIGLVCAVMLEDTRNRSLGGDPEPSDARSAPAQ